MKNIYKDRWANEQEAAEHWKLKPSTLRKRRSILGRDTTEIWTKLGGRVLYDIYSTDQKITREAV